MKRSIVWILSSLLAAGLLLVGCTPAGSNGLETAPADGMGTPTAAGGSEDVAIMLTREGGITGATESYKVYSDGTIELVDGTFRQVDPSSLDAALNAIEQAGFFDLTIAPLTGTCNDCYTYTITVTFQGKSNTVTATDNGELPQEFWTVLDEITKLVTG